MPPGSPRQQLVGSISTALTVVVGLIILCVPQASRVKPSCPPITRAELTEFITSMRGQPGNLGARSVLGLSQSKDKAAVLPYFFYQSLIYYSSEDKSTGGAWLAEHLARLDPELGRQIRARTDDAERRCAPTR